MSRSCLLAAIALFIASACAAAPTAVPTPTSEPPVSVSTTLSTQPFLREVTDRALTGPAPFVMTLAPTQPDLLLAAQTEPIIGLSLYFPEGTELWATPLGSEPIAIIVNNASQTTDFSLDRLGDIYAGRDPAWAAAVREDGDDSRLFFDSVALRGVKPAATIRIAPSPEAMIQYVSQTANAIGYIPLRWLTDSTLVRVATVDGKTTADADYPLTALVVAFASAEPSGAARQWLSNVQKGGTP